MRTGEPGAGDAPLERARPVPRVVAIVAVAGVEMDLPSANPEVLLHEAAATPGASCASRWAWPKAPPSPTPGAASTRPDPSPTRCSPRSSSATRCSIEAVRITARRGAVVLRRDRHHGAARPPGRSRAGPPTPSPWYCASAAADPDPGGRLGVRPGRRADRAAAGRRRHPTNPAPESVDRTVPTRRDDGTPRPSPTAGHGPVAVACGHDGALAFVGDAHEQGDQDVVGHQRRPAVRHERQGDAGQGEQAHDARP